MVATYLIRMDPNSMVLGLKSVFQGFIQAFQTPNHGVWVHTSNVSGNRFFISLKVFHVETLEDRNFIELQSENQRRYENSDGMCNILKLPKLFQNKGKIGVKIVYKAKNTKTAFFRKTFSKDMRRKIIFHDLVVPDMFQISPNGFKKSFLTILGTFWTLLSDIMVILKKVLHPPLKKFPGSQSQKLPKNVEYSEAK